MITASKQQPRGNKENEGRAYYGDSNPQPEGSRRANLLQSKRLDAGGSKRFASGPGIMSGVNNVDDDQKMHLQEIKTGHRQLPSTK